MAEPDLIISAGFSDAQLVKEANRIVAMYAKKGEEAQKAFQDAQGRVTNTQAAKAHVKDLDRLARAYDPVYRAAKEYEAEVARLDRALAVGAVTHERYADLVQQAAAKQAAAVDLASGATERAASAARAAEKIARESASADEAAAVAAQRLAVEKEQLRLKLDPLYAASKRYETALMDLDRALELGSLSAQQHGAAMEKLNADYARTAVVADQSAAEQARAQMEATEAAERLAAEMDRLKTKYDPVYAASKRYEASLIELDRALDKGALSAKQHEIALEKLNAEYARTAVSAGSSGSKIEAAADKSQAAVSRSSGSLKGQIQNTSFQIQDFAVQVASGTSASTALAQQLPQLLGGLGALGAVIGAVVAVGVPLAAAFLGAGDAAKELADSIDKLEKAQAAYDAAAKDSAATAADLAGKFGAATAQAQDLFDRIARLQYLDAVDAVGAAITKLSANFGDLQGYLNVIDSEIAQFGSASPVTLENVTAQIKEDFGLTVDQAREFVRLLSDAQAAQSIQDKAARLNEIAIYLDNAVRSTGDANSEMRALARSAAEGAVHSYELAKSADQSKDALVRASDAASTVAASVAGIDFSNAVAGANQLVAALQAGMAAIASLEGQQAMATKRAQIARDYAGDKVGAAGALGAVDFNATLDAANPYQGPLTREMQADIDARRDAYVEGEKELARIQEETQARLKAIADSSKGGGGGGGRKKSGGGARATKEPVNILESADREIQQLERQIELLGKSNQEVAVAEARWAMLDAAKKAGIPVNDTLNAQIDAQAEQVGKLTAQLEQAEITQEQFSSGIDAIVDSLFNAGKEGENFADRLKRALVDAGLQSAISDLKNSLNSLFSAGSGGGFLGSILGAALGGTKAAVPSYEGGGFTGYGGRSGGIDGRGGELAILHPNETVLDHTRGQAASGGVVDVRVTMDQNGNLQAYVERVSGRAAANMGQQVLAQVPATMRSHQMRRG